MAQGKRLDAEAALTADKWIPCSREFRREFL
jgi:hypothetical protein